jgi:arylsulfatase A-like enzyme
VSSEARATSEAHPSSGAAPLPPLLTLTLCAHLVPLVEAATHWRTPRAALAAFGLTAALTVPLSALLEGGRALARRAYPQARPRSAPEGWAWALVALCGALGVLGIAQITLPAAHRAFRREEYQALAVGLACVGVALLALLLAPLLARPLGASLHALSSRARPHETLTAPLTALAIGALALQALDHIRALHTLDLRPIWLGALWLWGQLWAPRVVGWVVERAAGGAGGRVGFINPARVTALWAAGVVWAAGVSGVGLWVAAAELTHASALSVERYGVISRWALSGARLMSDRDGDGASALWLGGDCDDADPKAHPGAREAVGEERGCDGHKRGAGISRRGISGAPPPPPAPPHAQHLILITLDAVRADAYARHMPHTQDLSKRATRFTNAYSAGATTYWSLPALLGSKPPSAFQMERDQTPALSERLLLESLRDGGLHTALLSNVTIFFVRGLSQGALTRNFDTSAFTRHGEVFGSAHMTQNVLKHIDLWRQGRLRPHKDRLALWAHYYDAHDPYFEVPHEPSGSSDRARYEAILRAMDREIAALLQGVEERGLLKHTVIALTADHGDEFGDHGGRFHGQTLYDEMTRVPLWIYAPNAPPRLIDTPVSHLDVAPTLLNLLGLPAEGAFWGQDLLSVDQPPAPSASRARRVFFEVLPDSNYGQHAVGVREGRWKLIYSLKTGRLELYDLEVDPQELQNRADERASAWLRGDARAPLLPLYHALMTYAEER